MARSASEGSLSSKNPTAWLQVSEGKALSVWGWALVNVMPAREGKPRALRAEGGSVSMPPRSGKHKRLEQKQPRWS